MRQSQEECRVCRTVYRERRVGESCETAPVGSRRAPASDVAADVAKMKLEGVGDELGCAGSQTQSAEV